MKYSNILVFGAILLNNAIAFTTEGIDVDHSHPVQQELLQMAGTYGPEIIRSFGEQPRSEKVQKGAFFYKIVPRGQEPSKYTPYWLDNDAYQQILDDPDSTINAAALPAISWDEHYDIYRIQALKDGLVVFKGKAAPAKDMKQDDNKYAVTLKGGIEQTIILNRANDEKHWSEPDQYQHTSYCMPNNQACFSKPTKIGDHFALASSILSKGLSCPNLTPQKVLALLENDFESPSRDFRNVKCSELSFEGVSLRLETSLHAVLSDNNPHFKESMRLLEEANGDVNKFRKNIYYAAYNGDPKKLSDNRKEKKSIGKFVSGALGKFRVLVADIFFFYAENIRKMMDYKEANEITKKYRDEFKKFICHYLRPLTKLLTMATVLEGINLDSFYTIEEDIGTGWNFRPSTLKDAYGWPTPQIFLAHILRRFVLEAGGLSAVLKKTGEDEDQVISASDENKEVLLSSQSANLYDKYLKLTSTQVVRDAFKAMFGDPKVAELEKNCYKDPTIECVTEWGNAMTKVIEKQSFQISNDLQEKIGSLVRKLGQKYKDCSLSVSFWNEYRRRFLKLAALAYALRLENSKENLEQITEMYVKVQQARESIKNYLKKLVDGNSWMAKYYNAPLRGPKAFKTE